MRNRILTVLQPVCLALLVSVIPLAAASASDAPAAGKHEVTSAAGAPAAHAVAADAHGAAVQHDAATGHGDAHASNPLAPAKLKDLFWRTVNFLALVIILVKFLGKPIGSALTGRQQQIKEELDGLLMRRDAAEKSYKEFEARLAGMEQEMESVVQRAIAQAQVEKERILAEAEKAAADIKRQAEVAVLAELEDAKRLLREEVAEQAAVMAEALIIKNLTPADQVAITEQYLERVGAVQ